MKKRIEKVVEWTKSSNSVMTEGKRYKVFAETKLSYGLMDNKGDLYTCLKEHLKVVTEREVLEFEVDIIRCRDSQVTLELMQDLSNIDLENYDFKVTATPKEKTYEEMSRVELIKLLKAKE